jgi:hypothetical protein
VAEDWRVTVTLHEEGLAGLFLGWLHEHRVSDDVRERLGNRVAVGTGEGRVFLYADTPDAAGEAERVVRDVLAARELEAEIRIDRWHPLSERWEDESVPLPRTEAEREAEREFAKAEDTAESQETGAARWEVRVELQSHEDAQALAERLERDGLPVVQRWTFLIVGANNEDEARSLAERLRGAVPGGATVHVEPGGGLVWQVLPRNPFAVFGGLGT